jgi:hypothetical protein
MPRLITVVFYTSVLALQLPLAAISRSVLAVPCCTHIYGH